MVCQEKGKKGYFLNFIIASGDFPTLTSLSWPQNVLFERAKFFLHEVRG